MTYKEIVVDILNDMDSDPVFTTAGIEDIASTEESRQVTQIVKTTYFNLIDGRKDFWPHLNKTFQLLNTGASTPTHMTIPTNAMNIDYVKYDIQTILDTRDRFSNIEYLFPKLFMDKVDLRDSSDVKIDKVTDPSGIFLNIFNERAPRWWTSLDDKTIIFDAYDSEVDTTNLVDAKTQCRGKIYPTVTETDAFVFDLPVDSFSFLLAEAKSVCFLVLKQVSNAKAEQQSITQKRRLSSEAGKVERNIQYPDYGRRGKRNGSGSRTRTTP